MRAHLDIKCMEHHDAGVRTTLTLDRDVAESVRHEMQRSGRRQKDVVNEGLRAGLGLKAKTAEARRFEVQPHAFGFKPGVDLDRLNQLADELGAEETARKLAR
jgi:hypothetical protein